MRGKRTHWQLLGYDDSFSTAATMRPFLCAAVLIIITATNASAQIVESVGNRALGMAGAFVAVAADSTATWWNPAGLATGPYSDISLGRSIVDLEKNETSSALRDRVSWFSAAVPVVGFSYYRLRITDIRGFGPTGQPSVNRQDTRTEVSMRSLAARQFGLTVVQSVLPGVHAGATLKYVRGTVRVGTDDGSRPASDLLEAGEELEGGNASNQFDFDVGLMAVAGPVRLGAVMRNVLKPDFGTDVAPFALARQTRIGAAIDTEQSGGPPFIFSIDADVRSYATGTGDRRVVALGAERWLWTKQIGVRGGARFNTVGAKERAATAGASVAVRNGLYVEGYLVRGGSEAERGWGLGTRVSF
jgi:F plasmid transfer operon, TraF, protein